MTSTPFYQMKEFEEEGNVNFTLKLEQGAPMCNEKRASTGMWKGEVK